MLSTGPDNVADYRRSDLKVGFLDPFTLGILM